MDDEGRRIIIGNKGIYTHKTLLSVTKIRRKIMVNKKLWLGILVMTLVFGITAVDSAFGQDTALNGKWMARASNGLIRFKDDIAQYTFLNGNYEIIKETGEDRMGRSILEPYEKGTYTTNAKGEIILKPTHYYDDFEEEWYSKDDFTKDMKSEGHTDAKIKEYFERNKMFIDRSFVYSILGSTTLELYQGREKFTYYKR
jgi:hypothetical protein